MDPDQRTHANDSTDSNHFAPQAFYNAGNPSIISVETDSDRSTIRKSSRSPLTPQQSSMRRQRQRLDSWFHRSNAMVISRQLGEADLNQWLVDEATTLRRWSELGIAAPLVVSSDGATLAMQFVAGPDLQTALRSNENAIWEAFFKTFHQIRNVAISQSDQSLLHGDPLPRNFIWNESTGQVFAIDPGQAGRMRGPIRQLDATLTLLLLHACIDLCIADHDVRLDLFLMDCERHTTEMMLDINGRITAISTLYQSISRFALARRSGSKRRYVRYSTDVIQLIDDALRRRLDSAG